MAQRARIILRCDQGGTDAEVARELGIWPQTVGTWRNRYIDGGPQALSDKDRPGQPRKITDAHVEDVIRRTLEQSPPEGGTHWSTRSMSDKSGLNQTAVSRIWRAFGLKPHLVEEWKLSNDPFFEKVRDVTGLYLNPPDAALVLCVDEKSQIQALNRSAPVLTMMPAVPERRTHDYVRAGTTTLFAALDAASGKVISAHHRRHRSIEFRTFSNQVDRETPPESDVHLIVDNYGTHKAPIIQRLSNTVSIRVVAARARPQRPATVDNRSALPLERSRSRTSEALARERIVDRRVIGDGPSYALMGAPFCVGAA